MPISTLGGSRYAGFWIRWVATLIDGVVITIIAFILQLVFIFFISPILGISDPHILFSAVWPPSIPEITGLVIGTLVSWAYYILMTNAQQATVGKILLGLHVESVDGRRLTLKEVIIRETIGKFLSGLTLFFGALMAGFTDKKQALHDKMARSVVIERLPHRE